MDDLRSSLTFVTDPGHGWLKVRFSAAQFSAAFWGSLRQQRLCPRCGNPLGAPYPIGCRCSRQGGG